jgi:hypothetical protein
MTSPIAIHSNGKTAIATAATIMAATIARRTRRPDARSARSHAAIATGIIALG